MEAYSNWSAAEYLSQYYAGPILSQDVVAQVRFTRDHLKGRSFRTALDYGCGPCLYAALALVPYVDHLDLADYLPENLEAIQAWLERRNGAHDWRYVTRYLLANESEPADQVDMRQDALRAKVRNLIQSDIRDRSKVAALPVYDLITSFFCLEGIGASRDEWCSFLSLLGSKVETGGSLLLATLRESTGYKVFDQFFPATYVNEHDLLDALVAAGFPEEGIHIEVEMMDDWTEQGFSGICLAHAER